MLNLLVGDFNVLMETYLLCAEVSGAIGFVATTLSSQLAMVPTTAVEKLDSVQLEMDPDDVMAASQRYQSRGVTAGASAVTVCVSVAESMLTLLLQLFRRFSPAGVYRLSLLAGAQCADTESRVGDAEFFIRKVLDRVCAESMECADVINSLCQQPAAVDDTTQLRDTHREDKDERHGFGFTVDWQNFVPNIHAQLVICSSHRFFLRLNGQKICMYTSRLLQEDDTVCGI